MKIHIYEYSIPNLFRMNIWGNPCGIGWVSQSVSQWVILRVMPIPSNFQLPHITYSFRRQLFHKPLTQQHRLSKTPLNHSPSSLLCMLVCYHTSYMCSSDNIILSRHGIEPPLSPLSHLDIFSVQVWQCSSSRGRITGVEFIHLCQRLHTARSCESLGHPHNISCSGTCGLATRKFNEWEIISLKWYYSQPS